MEKEEHLVPLRQSSAEVGRKGTINSDELHFSGTSRISALSSFNLFRSFSKPGSHLGSLFTIIISTIGGTILYMPSAFLASGLVWSSIIIIICGLLGFLSCSMLVHASEFSGNFSYPALAQATYGKCFKVYVKICFILYNWGMIVTYVILTGKLIGQFFNIILEGHGPDFIVNYSVRYFWQPVFMGVFIFPLSLFRNLSSLSYTCIAATVFIIFMSICIVAESFKVCDFQKNISLAKLFDFPGITTTFPAAVFAFTAHNNIPDVHFELNHRSERNMRRILLYSNFLVSVLYISVGLFGYVSFSDNTSVFDAIGGVVLIADKYSSEVPITMCLVMISLVMVAAIPLNVKPCKDTLLDLIRPQQKSLDSPLSHFILTLAVCGTSLALSISVENIGDVITVLGSLTNPVICYSLPALFCLKLNPKFGRKKWIRVLVFLFFVVLMTLFGFYSLGVFIASKI